MVVGVGTIHADTTTTDAETMIGSMCILIAVPFGMSTTTFCIYLSAFVVLFVGLIKIIPELKRLHGVDKIMPFGRLFYAIPLAVFASEHFTLTTTVARLVPRWIPAHTFWVYLIGVGFFCAALSIATLIQAPLTAALVAFTFFVFVATMDLPAFAGNPHNRFFCALMMRETAFGAGALAFFLSPPSSPTRAERSLSWMVVPRLLIALVSLFYGFENVLHPEYVPAIPLQKLTPTWIPGHILLSYIAGAVLISAGICLLLNKWARSAASAVGLVILLTILWVYLPMLVAAPKDVVALNFFFDTMLFCGATLLLANASIESLRAP